MTTERSDVRRWIAEAIGTFFLVLIGPGAAMVDAFSRGAIGHAGVSLSFAFVVIAMIYATGHLSGAHLNPAVTLGFWSARRFPAREVAPYIAAQCIGAVAASLALRAAIGNVGGMGATLPAVSVGAAFAVEWLLSFALMFVIMAVATDERVASGFAAIAVGLTVGFCAMMGGPLTGASMNPARSLGPAIVGGAWRAHWIYWAAPITAAMVGARTYEFLRGVRAPSGEMLGVEGAVS
ncbi:MAG: aquaporin NIP1-like [Gemmatimonadetes bacterium]|nr:aquaporin NIP1-like [Gemmatimonadota bacterium]